MNTHPCVTEAASGVGKSRVFPVSATVQIPTGRIVVAVPTVAASTYGAMESAADEIVAVIVPEYFRGVGEWYEDFSQTTDDEVCRLLAQAGARLATDLQNRL